MRPEYAESVLPKIALITWDSTVKIRFGEPNTNTNTETNTNSRNKYKYLCDCITCLHTLFKVG